MSLSEEIEAMFSSLTVFWYSDDLHIRRPKVKVYVSSAKTRARKAAWARANFVPKQGKRAARRQQAIAMLALGLSSREIERQLGMSRHTVARIRKSL